MKKILLVVSGILVVGIILCCGRINSLNMKTVKSIYVYHSGFGIRCTEYKIDLKDKKLYEFKKDNYRAPNRNVKSKNEGYQVIKKLSKKKVNKFIAGAQKLGLLEWNSKYENIRILDGHQWDIVISFDDGHKKEVTGSNSYPSSWDNMRTEFKSLTGEDILLLKSGWMK